MKRIQYIVLILVLTLLPGGAALAYTFDMAGDADLAFYGDRGYSYFGQSVAIGDFDADGYDDVAVGAPGWNDSATGGYEYGRVFVYWGADDDTTVDLQIVNDSPPIGETWRLGHDLAVGDINNDGIDDLLVSAPGAQVPAAEIAHGMVFVIYGRSSWSVSQILLNPYDASPDLADVNVFASGSYAAFGISIAAGDLNDDGYDEIIANDPTIRREGEVLVFFGDDYASETIIPVAAFDLRFISAQSMRYFGLGLAAGDVTGDDIDDLLIGEPANDGDGYVVFGRTGWGAPYSQDFASNPPDVSVAGRASTLENLGYDAVVGDFNGDGIGDIIFGAPEFGQFPEKAFGDGRVYMIYGDGSLSSTYDMDNAADADVTIFGENGELLHYGISLATGDIDGDCIDDLLGGSVLGNEGTRRAYAVFGSDEFPDNHTANLPGAAEHILNGEQNYDDFGISVAMGDVDNDLLADMLVGADWLSQTDFAVGAAYLVYAPDDNLPPIADAGEDQEADIDDEVTLDGSGSSDPEGNDLIYMWSQTSGPDVTLEGADTVSPTFTVPECGTFVFQLIVNDCLQDSEPDSVTIEVECPDEPDEEEEEEIPGLFGTGGCGSL